MGVEELKVKAPEMTAWASEMRGVFGEAQLLRLKEGEVQIGRPDPYVYATCFMLKKKK